MPTEALATAERALLEERRPLTRDEVLAVAHEPLETLPDLIALAHRVRLAYCGDSVELESLINAKSGACPEDCAFCSQSVKFDTGVDVYAFLDLDEVLAAARATRDAGATQFCIVVAVRGPSERLLDRVIEAVDAVHAETGLEVACSLGLLTPEQAQRLADAGVRRYNHNLEAPRARFPEVCTTHSYDDRVATARLATDAGIPICTHACPDSRMYSFEKPQIIGQSNRRAMFGISVITVPLNFAGSAGRRTTMRVVYGLFAPFTVSDPSVCQS